MSYLKLSIRAALAVAAVGAVAQSASALDVSAYNAATAVNVYLSGSTAVDNSLLNTALQTAAPGGLCQAGTIDVYNIGPKSGFTNRMIFCTASGNAGVTAGTPLAIFKESTVGSANGVIPLYNAAKGAASGVSFIDPTKITDAVCNGTDGGAIAASGTLDGYTLHTSCPAADVATNVIPNAGFADVEASILRTPTGGTLPSVTGVLGATGTVDQIWTVLLTKNAYYALQAAQGYTSPSDLPANAPSLSREDVAGLLSGNVYGWSQLGLAPADDTVYVCRRDVGSGTEASFEAYFLGARCSLSSLSMLGEVSEPAGSTTAAGAGVNVFAAGSAGGVRNCLQAVFGGGSIPLFYSSKATVTTKAGGYGIGINNAELKLSDLQAAGDSFRVVAVDGAGPTVANVQNGVYPYFSTGVAYQILAGTGSSANQKAVVTSLLGRIGHPTFTAQSNAGYTGNLPWSPTLSTGDAAPAPQYAAANLLSAVPSTSAIAAANPTNQYTKASSGSVNNCDTPTWDSGDLAGLKTGSVPGKLLGTGNINN